MLAFVPFGTRLTFGAPVLPVTRVRKNVWAHEALGEYMCCGARFRPIRDTLKCDDYKAK